MAGGNPVPQRSATETLPPTAVELRLRDSRCLHFDGTMDLVVLTALTVKLHKLRYQWRGY
jgi:hypothetical protein